MHYSYVYFNGQLAAQYKDSTTYFVHKDHLGSTRVMTKLDQSVHDSLDYLPYGEQVAGDTGSTHKFTGQERDPESGLDYFRARYFASFLGRFTSSDRGPYVWRDPQTLNRYAYTRNNPLKYVDPTGEYIVVAPELRDQAKQYISTMLRSNTGAKMVQAAAGSKLPATISSGNLPKEQQGDKLKVVTATTAAVPGNQPGQLAGTSTTIDSGNISTAANLTGQTSFFTGLKAFGHELAHVNDMQSQKTFQAAVQAGVAGDAPSQPGASDTTGGTAEGRALQVAGELGPSAQNFEPNAAADATAEAILTAGEQEHAQAVENEVRQAITAVVGNVCCRYTTN